MKMNIADTPDARKDEIDEERYNEDNDNATRRSVNLSDDKNGEIKDSEQ